MTRYFKHIFTPHKAQIVSLMTHTDTDCKLNRSRVNGAIQFLLHPPALRNAGAASLTANAGRAD